jgi:hypothetical protein
MVGKRSRWMMGGAVVVAAITTMSIGARASTPESGTDSSFNVSINAQAHVKVGEHCVAYANVYGGTPPYEYEWWGSFVGTTQIVWETLYESGTANLKVTDAFDNVAFDDMPITVSSSGGPCFE